MLEGMTVRINKPRDGRSFKYREAGRLNHLWSAGELWLDGWCISGGYHLYAEYMTSVAKELAWLLRSPLTVTVEKFWYPNARPTWVLMLQVDGRETIQWDVLHEDLQPLDLMVRYATHLTLARKTEEGNGG